MILEKTHLVMGVLNVTSDSFSDGGSYLEVERAVQHALTMVEEGADIIDIGGESSRPFAMPISLQEELDRVAPVVECLSSVVSIPISIDTRHFEVASVAVELGACIVNDVSGGSDIRMAEIGRKFPVTYCLMHMQNDPQTMQVSPHYPDGVVNSVKWFLRDRVRAFDEAGIAKERIWIDPGIGFGKTLGHNLEILRNLRQFLGIGDRVLVGTSRKSFLARLLNDPELPMERRLEGTLASNLFALEQGASIFRVHDVGSMVRALKTWEALHA